MPPNDPKALVQWRKKTLGLPEKPEEAGSYDLVVVGAGDGGEWVSGVAGVLIGTGRRDEEVQRLSGEGEQQRERQNSSEHVMRFTHIAGARLRKMWFPSPLYAGERGQG